MPLLERHSSWCPLSLRLLVRRRCPTKALTEVLIINNEVPATPGQKSGDVNEDTVMVVYFQQSLRILHNKDEQFGIGWSFGSVKRYLLPGASVGLAISQVLLGLFKYVPCSE